MEELRNYILLMDKYSLHNFMIYDGRALRDTPEFQSFKRTYQHRWGSITAVILQLEEFLAKHEVKLAIINGPKVYELSQLNLPTLTKEDIFPCIANSDQIEIFLDSSLEMNKRQLHRAVTKIQSIIRRFLAIRKFNRLVACIKMAVKIQSIVRRMLARSRILKMVRTDMASYESRWAENQEKLREFWHAKVYNSKESAEGDAAESSSRERAILYIPSISIAEYLRLDFENFHATQNSHVSVLYQLADPDVHLIFLTPCQMSNYEVAYHEKFLSLMGISLLPKRLHFVTPELISKLPQHLPLSQVLWYSTHAMRKIRAILRRFRNACFVTTSVSWVEKRLANYFNLPMLCGDPMVVETLSSRSFLKKVFMDSNVNIPIGSHDVYCEDELLIALSRLIASNLGVGRWVIRLNYDWNSESTVFLDVEKMAVTLQLRTEQNEIAGTNHENISHWFTRQVQLATRKKLLAALKKEFHSKIRICRRDVYPSWEFYCRLMKQYGAVVEAEPIEKIGFVSALFLIDPFGAIADNIVFGVEVHMDDNQQVQGYSFPQTVISPLAVEGATQSIAKTLFHSYAITGYVTVKYLSYWDALDKMPRMWATGIHFGMSPIFGALGTSSTLVCPSRPIPRSLMPHMFEGRSVVYIPVAMHAPLRTSHDDIFFKLCKMRGIAFDVNNRVGTLFFLIDAIVGGAVSVLCIGSNRRKVLELVVHTLSFIAQQFGKDTEGGVRKCENLTNMLINMKRLLKNGKESK